MISHRKRHLETGQFIEYHIVFFPDRSELCERFLEHEGIYGGLWLCQKISWDSNLLERPLLILNVKLEVHIHVFPMYLVPLDRDILTMELPEVFREVFLVRSQSNKTSSKDKGLIFYIQLNRNKTILLCGM